MRKTGRQLRVGTLTDRIANRVVRHFPGPKVEVAPSRPIVSFTFDDAPESAWTHGASILETVGARGTFYIAGALVGTVEPDRRLIPVEGCIDLARRGHELGCHTYSHDKLARYSKAALSADLERNAAFLAECDGRTGQRNFAVPYAMSWPPAQAGLRRRFRSSRSGIHGCNRGSVDPYNLRAVGLGDGGPDLAAMARLLDDLAARPGWLIFFTHDVTSSPTRFGCRTGNFAGLVEMVADRDCAIMTVDAAIDSLGFHPGHHGEEAGASPSEEPRERPA